MRLKSSNRDASTEAIRCSSPTRLVVFALLAIAPCGCGLFTTNGRSTRLTVEKADPGTATCPVARDPLNPFIVEWPAARRTSLESASQDGLLAVSYAPCGGLKVLSNCKLPGRYEFRRTSLASDTVKIYDEDSLWADLPLGAVSLQGEVGQGRGLELNYTTVGERVASEPAIGSMTGECAGASHYVKALTIGAYELNTVSISNIGGGVHVGPAGGGARTSSSHNTLQSGGQLAKCQELGTIGIGCDAVLQLRLAPLPGGAGKLTVSGAAKSSDKGPGPAAGGDTSYEELMKKAKALEARQRREQEEQARRQAELDEQKRRLEQEQARRRQEIDGEWAKAQDVAGRSALPKADRVAFVQRFLDAYPQGNHREQEAKELIAAVKAGRIGAAGAAGIEWVYSKPAGVQLAKTETTVAQYAACVQAGSCEAKHHATKSDWDKCNWGHSDRDDHPMNCVDWYGADQFCKWAGGRLPTEDEWYAEASESGRRKYPWGDREVDCSLAIWGDGSNTDGCGKDRTWPVCSKTAGNSVSGLCDMSGNLWEWTSTWYDNSQKERVLRGGSWNSDDPEYLRASYRFGDNPGSWYLDYGFRCAVSSH